jgi:signal transduction histidine kinase
LALRARPWRIDGAVTAAVGVVTGLDVWWSGPGTRPADALSYVLLGFALLAVAGRRFAPLVAAVVCAGVLVAWTLLGHRGELLNLPALVCLYTVAVQGGRGRTMAVGVPAVVSSALLGWWVSGWSSAPVTDLLWPIVALLLGEVVRGRHELRREYADRAARLVAQRDREANDRVQRERLTIAREVHDVVAHTMAGVNVHMGVAVAAFDRNPEAARQALGQARAASKDALGELRAAVALLRGPAEAGPAPRLADLTRLVEQSAAAGVRVSLHNHTSLRPPLVVEVAMYRIVQEALTNVVRHARATAASVTITADEAGLTVEVLDNGAGRDGDPAGAGFGRAGMAERAAALGGRLESGPVPGGGFRVWAVLPVGGAA